MTQQKRSNSKHQIPVDKKLIEAFRKGDHAAFGKILTQSLEPCLRLAIRIVGNREEAEDIVQDSFIRLWEKRKYIKNTESFIGWIRKIVVNRCYDYLRREKRRARFVNEAGSGGIDYSAPGNEADRDLKFSESNEILKIITNSLSPKQKIVFILSEIEELSVKEIEKVTGMTSYSIKSNCYHARKRAREIYNILENR